MTGYEVADLLAEIRASEIRWVRRFEWHLDQIPPVLAHLHEKRGLLRVTQYDAVRVSGSSDVARAPMNLGEVDDGDDLWSALVEYTEDVAEHLGVHPPEAVAASWRRSGGAVGLSAGLDELGVSRAAYGVTSWLIDRAHDIKPLKLSGSESHVFRLVRGLRDRYLVPPVERESRRRFCTVCVQFDVVAVWVSDPNGRSRLEVTCRTCGSTFEEPDEDDEDDDGEDPGGG